MLKHSNAPIRAVLLVALGAFAAIVMPPAVPVAAQQPPAQAPQLRPSLPPPQSPTAPPPVGLAKPAAPQAAVPADKGLVKLAAQLTDDGEPIDQGLIWRAYADPGDKGGAPRLVGTWRDANPSVVLPPGIYHVNVGFGRAHLTRRIAVTAGASKEERFVVNAGGLRVTAVLGEAEKVPDLAVSYDVLQGDTDQIAGRERIVGGLKPGIIVRLNAGLYHIVSTIGDANAVVNADVTVEAGKLTDAVIHHHAARVTFKLVTRADGDAQADTQWTIHTDHGELVHETQGALPTHILGAGNYIASARHAGRLYQRPFSVKPGEPQQVELMMQ